MSIHTTLETDSSPYPTMSASGARLKAIRPVGALIFFEQLAVPIQGICRRILAWGAFEDCTTLIGAAALARLSGTTFRAQIAVAPARRRLGIGAELLDVAIREASAGGGRRLIGSYPTCALEPQALFKAQPLSTARRVRHGHAEVVLFIPEPPAKTPGGQR